MYYEEHRCKEHEEDADAVARYGIADVVDSTGISAYTIRYYDKCGFFPDLARDHRGVRSFSQIDIAQLHFVDALRKWAVNRGHPILCALAETWCIDSF